MKLSQRILIQVLLVGLFAVHGASAQTRQAVVHDTRPVIMNGPYLIAPTETGVTVAWTTDTPSYSKVLYGVNGNLTEVAEPVEKGLKPVGTLHTVRLTGLTPGQTYDYRIVSTRVVKIKSTWPENGLSVESPVYSFTVPDSNAPDITFSFITDTQHEDVRRINANLDLVEWERIDFLVHGGDALDHVKNHEQVFANFLDPITNRLDHRKPLVYMRGNHEARGPYARNFYDYVRTEAGEYYYAFDAGPVHFIVLDSGEDKADDHPEYSGLNQFAPYMEQEFAWFKEHVEQNPRVHEAPFTIVLVHNPRWGYVEDPGKWTRLANEAGVDLVMSGHLHRFVHTPPGENGNDFPILVTDQDQITTVTATQEALEVVIVGEDGAQIEAFTVQR